MSAYDAGDRLRIGDAEREEAQSRLADHYAAGRLDHDEYTQRLDQVWGARTRAELDPVFRDLPRPGSQPFSSPQSRRPRSAVRSRRPGLPAPLLVLLVALGAVAVVAHLPIILVGLGIWFFVLRGGCGTRMHARRW